MTEAEAEATPIARTAPAATAASFLNDTIFTPHSVQSENSQTNNPNEHYHNASRLEHLAAKKVPQSRIALAEVILRLINFTGIKPKSKGIDVILLRNGPMAP
jgi:hypothetical protein